MALYVKSNPVGLDIPIQRLQNLIYNGLGWNKYDCYGRVYPIERDGKTYPEYFSTENEYKELMFDDRNLNAMSFFYEESNRSYSDYEFTVGVNLVFLVNLKSLYPAVTHRADEECHNAVGSILRKEGFWRQTGLITGINNALSEFNIDKTTSDMQPKHVFRFQLEMKNNFQLCN